MKQNKMTFHGDGVKIKIAIITLDEPIYIPQVIEGIIKNSSKEIEIKSITILPTIPKKFSKLGFLLYQQKLMGRIQFSKILISYLKKKIQNFLEIQGISVICKKNNITLVKKESISTKEYQKFLKNDEIDVLISIASPEKFSGELISIPKKACINVHAGKLPKYRGINPTFWSLLNEEPDSAVTVHHISEEFDDGNILNQEFYDLQGINSLDQAYQKILGITPKIILKTLEEIQKGKTKEMINDSSKSSYYSFPTIEDGEKFRKLGLKFI